ncbi:hypothetical protein [endosymbiont GvMRE of Glomus versiforme]|uniref:hypothetical protein n=1 Tax=endosymbiont GvMRE of Glomus versiforme TaxID=2039283 RepID=UPI000ECCF52E|nr:hypothetical protein [endosymbiont GvMRE of Glomus versiforme]RHZ35781.1 hypothetical protein GvMRE_Ic5g51 [endosymbiont GvMRE of Glomus versiforme]
MNNLWTKLTNWFKPKPKKVITFYNIKGEKRIIEEEKLRLVAKPTKFKGINYKKYRLLFNQSRKETKRNERKRKETLWTE